MRQPKKLGNTRGFQEWQALETIGDVKRLVRWAILSFRDQTLTSQQCNTFIVAANTLAGILKTCDIEKRIDEVEKLLKGGAR